MYSIVKPLLLCLRPELSHNITLQALQLIHRCGLLPKKYYDKPVEALGLTFANPVGLAAGLDKQGQYGQALEKLGFGFIESGTVVPRPQPGNVRPRLFRLKSRRALINRFGFNSVGVDAFIKNISRYPVHGVHGINVGKNVLTPNAQAVTDYLFCIERVYTYADYITVNLSSPNTPGLRLLQHGDALEEIVMQLKAAQHRLADTHKKWVPLVVKVAPDLTTEVINMMSEIFLKHQVEGVIATNTALSRESVPGHHLAQEAGGLSGHPIHEQSTTTLRQFKAALGDDVVLIAAGGIDSAKIVADKLAAGATLIQLYTGLIYYGPKLVKVAYEAC